MVWLLAKPADIRTPPRPAGATREFAFGIDVMVGERRTTAIRGAPALKQFAVDVDHLLRARGFMQAIHVLRAQKQSAGQVLLPLGQRNVRRVGPGIAGAGATVRVILPNQLRVALPRFNIRQFVMAVATPVGPLKHRNPTFRADAGPGQDKELRSRAERGTSIIFAVLADHDFTSSL